jgi:hypothetical protein
MYRRARKFGTIRTVTHQTAGGDEIAPLVERRNTVTSREHHESIGDDLKVLRRPKENGDDVAFAGGNEGVFGRSLRYVSCRSLMSYKFPPDTIPRTGERGVINGNGRQASTVYRETRGAAVRSRCDASGPAARTVQVSNLEGAETGFSTAT